MGLVASRRWACHVNNKERRMLRRSVQGKRILRDSVWLLSIVKAECDDICWFVMILSCIEV
jgi:hypothetical protein